MMYLVLFSRAEDNYGHFKNFLILKEKQARAIAQLQRKRPKLVVKDKTLL